VVCPLATTKTFAGSYTMTTVDASPQCAVNGGAGAVDSAHPHNLPN